MKRHSFPDSPFQIQLSFFHIVEELEKRAAGPEGESTIRAKALLAEVAQCPELVEGLTTFEQIEKNQDLIHRLLADYFPKELTLNEIKAINLPYTDLLFNHTERFKNILKAAGPDFSFNIRDFDEHQFYVLSCCLILNEFYGTTLDFSRPLFYDIPTADGVIKHYRILYNADFLDILPTEKALTLTADDIDLLLDSYDDLDLWKSKFPKESWTLKGFAIMTLYDATVENAVSIFKERLLGMNAAGFEEKMQSIFRSIYRIPDIKVGFTLYNQEEDQFSASDPFSQYMTSFIVQGQGHKEAHMLLCSSSYNCLIKKKEYFAISDVGEFITADPENLLGNYFHQKGIKSFILAPVVKNGQLLGVLELLSLRTKELNSINANKLEVVMPYLTDTMERLLVELQNEIQAVIQEKFTAIHSSVYWKFREEVQQLIAHREARKDYALQEIVFPDVYPLYGQIDIKGSSEVRNASVQQDLQLQIKTLCPLIKQLSHPEYAMAQQEVSGWTSTTTGHSPQQTEAFGAVQEQLRDYLIELSFPLRAGTEQYITAYLASEVHPLLQRYATDPRVQAYFAETDKEKGAFHLQRRKYETTISSINNKLSDVIDRNQTTAQTLFPHYYERFKTDGIEHNLYIGASISPKQAFSLQKLYDLRLWQLQTLCEMEIAHHRLKAELPYPLDVTSLILVYNATIAIRFRMDEKRFDVDGSYNARFEIVKKRIDKAFIKDTTERITQAGKITIVFSSNMEEQEYLRYIKTLQSQMILENDIEQFDVEDLQGVSGLKAIRVKIVH
ncbi:GAF domain-containing protein [Chitinophaga filiformis]|uniref:GAF domain-containing protein n=1 Tax=Chitinophaga filiformis TaxID=104663 RepID=UPI001F36AE48|nr:GAF domain-containing protein [Chitinophaga filiformis]MCF6407935.1 GAF domain-containing protein [Chitinophaga filiformis]